MSHNDFRQLRRMRRHHEVVGALQHREIGVRQVLAKQMVASLHCRVAGSSTGDGCEYPQCRKLIQAHPACVT